MLPETTQNLLEPKIDWQSILAIVSAIIALGSIVLGPIISLKIVRLQVAKTEQKERIQALQASLVAYIAGFDLLAWHYEFGEVKSDDPDMAKRLDELHRLRYAVFFQLDPSDNDHERLKEMLISSLGMLVQQPAPSYKILQAEAEKLLNQAHSVIINERNRLQ